MKPSKIALLALGGGIAAAIVVAAVATRVTIGRSGQAFAQHRTDSGAMASVTHDLRDFTEIEVRGSWTVNVSQGDEWQVNLSAPENRLRATSVSVRGERLSLSGTSPGSFFGRSNGSFSAEIVMPALEELDAAGSSRVTLTGFSGERLAIDVAGASQITGEDGRYDALDLSMAGAGDVRLGGFVFTDANVNLAGASNLELTMNGGELTGAMAGAGRIHYFGTVSRETIDIAGFGSIGPAQL